LISIITGNHYSLVNIPDGDFSVGRTAHQLFEKKETFKDHSIAYFDDLFQECHSNINNIIEQIGNAKFQ
jgi:hypothetical protein